MSIESTEQLRGVAVVVIDAGMSLGTVARALFDPATLALRALHIARSGRTFIVPWEVVETIDDEAVTVARSRVAPLARQGASPGQQSDAEAALCDTLDRLGAPLAAFGQLVDRTALQRLQVIDMTGDLVGTLSDITPDPATGKPLRLTIVPDRAPNRFAGTVTIDAAKILDIGADKVTIAAAWLPEIGNLPHDTAISGANLA